MVKLNESVLCLFSLFYETNYQNSILEYVLPWEYYVPIISFKIMLLVYWCRAVTWVTCHARWLVTPGTPRIKIFFLHMEGCQHIAQLWNWNKGGDEKDEMLCWEDTRYPCFKIQSFDQGMRDKNYYKSNHCLRCCYEKLQDKDKSWEDLVTRMKTSSTT